MYRCALALVVLACSLRPALSQSPRSIPSDSTLDATLTAILAGQAPGSAATVMTGTIESQFTDPNRLVNSGQPPLLGRPVNAQMADLGRNLFFDKILGLNNDNSCAGCHSPYNGFGDTQPIAIGVGNNNIVGPGRKGPRNMRRAPLVINTPLYPNMMWNSRFVAQSNNPFNPGTAAQGFQFPAPEGQGFGNGTAGPPRSTTAAYSLFFGAPSITNNPLSLNIPNLATAQVFLPTVQFNEMAGFNVPGTIVPGTIGAPGTKNRDRTAVAVAGSSPFDPADAHNVIRNTIVARLNGNENYRKLFRRNFPGQITRNGGITYTMVATAIAEFEFSLVRANAPIDQYARGLTTAMTSKQKYGAILFFTPTSSGGAGCVTCHAVSGTNNEMFSDFAFHASGVPQIVPSRTNTALDSDANGTYNQDFAWFEFTTRPGDQFKFRTAPLRNVGALSNYFFHDGAFNSLEDAIRFHLDANRHAPNYSPKGRLPDDLQTVGPIAPILQLLNNQPGNPGTFITSAPGGGPLPNGLNVTVLSSTAYKIGDILTVTGGTFTTQATLKVTAVSVNGTATAAVVNNPGSYTVPPSNPVATTDTTTTSAKGATFNLTFNSSGQVTGVSLAPTNPLATPVVLNELQFRCLVDFVRNGLLDRRAQPDALAPLIPQTLPSGMTPLEFQAR